MALGSTELVILFAVGIFLFGAKRLPELARNAGRAKGEFQQGLRDVSNPSKAEIDMERGGISEEFVQASSQEE
ncbi:MAG: translocase [Candidatus Poseidoniales archaeon]|nr:MAG: translocase [Candidatus Poseidoniales archaeon]|tara:strand:- start:80 stop:298 length:219 start_codon:yes stop_codon:yes gene_type:complete